MTVGAVGAHGNESWMLISQLSKNYYIFGSPGVSPNRLFANPAPARVPSPTLSGAEPVDHSASEAGSRVNILA